jgi:hypothetical protein
MNKPNTNIQKLDIAVGFQPSDETFTAVRSYLDTLENNNHPTYHTKNFRGTTLVEMKDIIKSDFFSGPLKNTIPYYRIMKMVGGLFQVEVNGIQESDRRYGLSFTTQLSRIVYTSQCDLPQEYKGIPPSFYRTLEEFCIQRKVSAFDYPFVIGMLVTSVIWNDAKLVNSLDADIQTWFVERFKNDLKTFAKPVQKIKLIKKAA